MMIIIKDFFNVNFSGHKYVGSESNIEVFNVHKFTPCSVLISSKSSSSCWLHFHDTFFTLLRFNFDTFQDCRFSIY